MVNAGLIKSNSLFSFLSTSSRLVANFIIFWILARFYGPELFGQFTFAHTLATTFIIFADFGLDVLVTTEIAQNPARWERIFSQYFSIKLLFSITAFFIMIIIGLVSDLSESSRIITLIFSFFVVFSTMTNLNMSVLKGFEKLKYEAMISGLYNFLLLLIVLVLILVGINIITIAIGFVAARGFGFVLSIITTKRILPEIKFRFNINSWTLIKDKVIVFGVHLIFAHLLLNFDTLLLAYLSDDYSVGIYQSVFKLAMLVLIIPDILVNSLLPTQSRFFIESKHNWDKLGYSFFKLLIIIALPILFFLFNYSKEVIDFVYGKSNYTEAAPLLKIFAVVIFIRYSVEPLALTLTTSNRQKSRMIVVASCALINLSLNLILIPQYNTKGAAYAALISTLLLGIGFIGYNYKYFFEWISQKQIILPAIVVAVFMLVPSFHLMEKNVFFLPVFIVVYAIIIFGYSITKDERDILLSSKVSKI